MAFTVAANLANRHSRREKSELRLVQGLSLNVDSSDDPADQIIQQETVKRVKEALAKLPAEQQQVVLLKFEEGMKFREIAEHLGIPLGTVQTRMHTAIKKLRSQLGRD